MPWTKVIPQAKTMPAIMAGMVSLAENSIAQNVSSN